jgi:hypothetical protein
MITMRNIHITELPTDRTYVQFSKEFHQKFFNVIKKGRFEEINYKFFGCKLNYNTFKQWRQRKNFLPLWYVLKHQEIFVKNMPLTIVEKNIIAYKGPSSSTIIKFPNFPLQEDKRMIKILAHLIGDGSVSGAFGTALPKGKSHSEYRNFSNYLLDSFVQDIQIFGQFDVSINYKHGHVIVPNLIGYILKHLYQIKFDTFNSRLPASLFNSEPELAAAFIRAFADDEAHVYDSSIEFYSANKELLKDISYLIRQKFPVFDISNIKKNSLGGKNPKYSFSVLKDSLESFRNLIGFDCPNKKERLRYSIERRKLYQTFRINKNVPFLINKMLHKEPKVAYEIAKELMISHRHALRVLNKLEKEGEVRKLTKTTHGAWLWDSKP